MTTKPTIKKISIKDLSLWDENPRFPDRYLHKNEKELIRHLVSKKDYKILDLARKIVDGFYTPPLEKLVVFKTKNENIVLEGNRRLACYKLLANPELIDTKIKKEKLYKLNSNIDIDNKYKLECIVTDNKEQAELYVEQKHLRSNNELGWGDNERAHYSARKNGRNAAKGALLKVHLTSKINELSSIPEQIKDQVVGRGFVTTLWRLLNQGPAWKTFGYDTGGANLKTSDKQFDKKLVIIIHDVISKVKFKNKLLSRLDVEEIESYLTGISVSRYKEAKDELSKKGNAIKPTSPKPDASKPTPKPKPSQRKTLIPKYCQLTIEQPKIESIYLELKEKLLLDGSTKSVPNAVGVLFRVFLETSLDYYIKKNNIIFNTKNRISIKYKIEKVVDNLINDKGYSKKSFKNITKVRTSNHVQSFLSVDHLHDYVHSTNTQPPQADLKIFWGNLQEFFEILWGELSKK